MQIFAGTSGFSYTEWRGRFYPQAFPESQMLRFYSERLPTVEINNTFYQLPKHETMAAWRDAVPDSFCFSVKASRRITHQARLANAAADVQRLFDVIGVLGDKLGPVLFQLPPFLKKDLGLLSSFLEVLPHGRRAAFEFRHSSWFEDDVYAVLASKNVALVGGDLEEAEKSPPLVATADFGYLRLRRMDYEPAGIAGWAERIAAQKWSSVYAYLKHEVLGPLFAESLLAASKGEPQPDLSAVRASIAAPAPKRKSSRAGSQSKTPEPRVSKAPAPRSSKAPGTRATKPKAPTKATAKPSKS